MHGKVDDCGDKARHSEAKAICLQLSQAGFETRLVGGCVRDRLMGKIPKDYDLATAGEPQAVMVFFEARGYRVIPTGMKHGTISLVTPLQTIEITTLRLDVHCNGRHAEVTFSTDFETDAKRRDFTINALFEDGHGQIYDYVEGQADLLARRLSFVGDPVARIQEDYLRILRYFRFLGRYGWEPEPRTIEAITTQVAGLNQLSKERIETEISQILLSPFVGKLFCAMFSCRVLSVLFPWVDGARVQRLAPLMERFQGMGAIFGWFALLFLYDRNPPPLKDLQDRFRQMRLTRHMQAQLSSLSQMMMHWENGQKEALLSVCLYACAQKHFDPKALRLFMAAMAAYVPFFAANHVRTLLMGMEKKDFPQIPRKIILTRPRSKRKALVTFLRLAWFLDLWSEESDLDWLIAHADEFWRRIREAEDIGSFCENNLDIQS